MPNPRDISDKIIYKPNLSEPLGGPIASSSASRAIAVARSIVGMEADALNPEHAHQFDARLLILEGAMTVTAEGDERTYRTGDTFKLAFLT